MHMHINQMGHWDDEEYHFILMLNLYCVNNSLGGIGLRVILTAKLNSAVCFALHAFFIPHSAGVMMVYYIVYCRSCIVHCQQQPLFTTNNTQHK